MNKYLQNLNIYLQYLDFAGPTRDLISAGGCDDSEEGQRDVSRYVVSFLTRVCVLERSGISIFEECFN